MNLWLPILVLALTSAFGFWWRSQQGKFKVTKAAKTTSHDRDLAGHHKFISNDELGIPLGSRVTVLQFSSAFCSPCKATAQIISAQVADMEDVAYVQIKSEENLKLVEKFDIKSTPTVIFFNSQAMEVGRAVGIPTKDQVLSSIAAVR